MNPPGDPVFQSGTIGAIWKTPDVVGKSSEVVIPAT